MSADSLRRLEQAFIIYNNHVVRELCTDLGRPEAADKYVLSAKETATPGEETSKLESERIQKQIATLFKKRKVPSMTRPTVDEFDDAAEDALLEVEAASSSQQPPPPPPPLPTENAAMVELRKCLAKVAVEANVRDHACSI